MLPRKWKPAPAPENGDVLRFEGVSRHYPGVLVVDDLHLDLHQGEILTLLGPSGCGKTTTLRMAIGLERCSSGRVWHRGELVDAPAERIFLPPERRDMGMVFQSYAIWPHLTVFENVAFPLRARRVPKGIVEERVAAALAMTGMAEFADRAGTQLSGGQQQRVAVARGLSFNPDGLLMDEPFSNLDANRRDQLRIEVKALQRQLGISILFVTHDQTEALAISDRIAVMSGGKIEQIGTPTELYAEPETEFVRDFLGPWIKLDVAVIGRAGPKTAVRLADGTTLTASGPSHASGPGAVMAIRPEYLEISPDGLGVPENRIRARIASLQFLGRTFEANVILTTGEQFTIHLSTTRAWTVGQDIDVVGPGQAISLWPMPGQS